MRVFKINLYKLQTKRRNSFTSFAHTLLFLSKKTFFNSNERFSITLENNVVLLMLCFVEVYKFKFFMTRFSNIIYRKFSFFFLNFLFMSLFIFIFANFLLAFIVFFFSSFFSSFICCSIVALNRKIVSIIYSFIFVKRFRKRRFFR